MGKILIGRTREEHMHLAVLDGMFRLRDSVFRKRLGWDVNSVDGYERDHYDNLDPVYMISVKGAMETDGCWRLLPTTRPYMLKDTFPELLRGEPAPQHPQIWELSRFAVLPKCGRDIRQPNLSSTTLEMIRAAIDFADRHSITTYVTVTSVALERLLRRIGIPLQRFGDGKAQKVGNVLSIACRVPVNDAFRDAVHCRGLPKDGPREELIE